MSKIPIEEWIRSDCDSAWEGEKLVFNREEYIAVRDLSFDEILSMEEIRRSLYRLIRIYSKNRENEIMRRVLNKLQDAIEILDYNRRYITEERRDSLNNYRENRRMANAQDLNSNEGIQQRNYYLDLMDNCFNKDFRDMNIRRNTEAIMEMNRPPINSNLEEIQPQK